MKIWISIILTVGALNNLVKVFREQDRTFVHVADFMILAVTAVLYIGSPE